MRRLFLAILVILAGVSPVWAQATGRAANMPIKTDANGYLIATAYQITAPASAGTIFSNTFIKTDANGYLLVAIADGASLSFAAVTVLSGGTLGWSDIYLSRNAAGKLGLSQDSTHGVVLDVTTDGRLNIRDRTDTGYANLFAGSVLADGTLQAGTTQRIRWGSSTVMLDIGNGVVQVSNNAEDAGVRWSYTTDGVAALLTRAGTDAATFRTFALTLGGGTLLTTSAALTDGAAAQVATMTNGPAAGNPTKWIPIDDAGTTRYIPVW